MKRVSISLAACFLLSLLMTGQLWGESAQRWKIGHVRPEGSAIDRDIRWFTGQAAERTEGRVVFDIYPGNRLGDYSVVQERVSFGEVEMFIGPFGANVDKRMALGFTPYLVSTWEEAGRVYRQGSPLFAAMESLAAQHNLHLVGGWPVYFGGIALTEIPETPYDPSVAKNLIIRIPPVRSFELTAREIGFTPYPITWMYARMGLKTGMVQGMIGGGAEGYAGLKDLVKAYLPVKDHFEYWFLYVNRTAWEGLTEGDRAVLADLAHQMEERRYQAAEAEEKASLALLASQGTEVIEATEQQIDALRTTVREKVWPVLRREMGTVFDELVNSTR